MREWKEKNQLLPTDELGMPVELLNMVKSLWSTLKDKTDAELEQERSELKVESTELAKALMTERQNAETLQKQLHHLDETNHQLNQQLQTQQQLRQDAAIEIQRLNERTSVMKERNQSQEKEQQRLHDLINHLQKNLEHYQESSQQLRQEQTIMLDKQRQDYEQKVSQLQKTLNDIQKSASITDHKLTQANAELEAIAHQYHQMKDKNAETQKSNEKLNIELKLLQDAHKQLQSNYHQQVHTISTLEEKITNEKTHSSHIKGQFQQAEGKIEKLRTDNQFLAQEKAKLEGYIKRDRQSIMLPENT